MLMFDSDEGDSITLNSEEKSKIVEVCEINESSLFTVMEPPVPETSLEHSHNSVAAFHLRSCPVEHPRTSESRSPAACRPELEDVTVDVPLCDKRIVLASMYPVDEVIVTFNEPARITPEKVETPFTVRLPANVELPTGKLIPPLGSSLSTLFAAVPAWDPSTVS